MTQAPAAAHATALLVGASGLLLRGPPGSGKSGLALRLIDAAQGRGLFARLIGDDRVLLESCNGRLIARPHEAIAGAIELRALGIVRLPYEFLRGDSLRHRPHGSGECAAGATARTGRRENTVDRPLAAAPDFRRSRPRRGRKNIFLASRDWKILGGTRAFCLPFSLRCTKLRRWGARYKRISRMYKRAEAAL